MWAKSKQTGFTIVELLIVIVVIAILAAISVIAYRGIQDRAKVSSISSALTQASKAVALYKAQNDTYPATLAAASVSDKNSISYQYSYNATAGTYCITALYDNQTPYNITNSSSASQGPCDGQSGGAGYCPTTSYVDINGYYCDGTEGSVATLNSNAVKLTNTASGVPAGAPSMYVGRQSTRDNYLSSNFTVVAGEVYCVEAWVASTASTVNHAVGLQINNGSTNIWQNGGAVTAPSATWKKISGCITVPAGYITARMWSQNDGTNGTTADAHWYQTAVKLTKQ